MLISVHNTETILGLGAAPSGDGAALLIRLLRFGHRLLKCCCLTGRKSQLFGTSLPGSQCKGHSPDRTGSDGLTVYNLNGDPCSVYAAVNSGGGKVKNSVLRELIPVIYCAVLPH